MLKKKEVKLKIFYTTGEIKEVSINLKTISLISYLQEIVDGYIEIIRISKDLILVCNEDGRPMLLESNEAYNNSCYVFETGNIVGNCVILESKYLKLLN